VFPHIRYARLLTTERLGPTVDDLTRRTFLRTAAGAAVVATAAGTLGEADIALAAERRPFLPYGPRSYFRTPVRGARIDRARTRSFRRFMARHPEQRDHAYPRINGVDGNDWGTAYAMGHARHPVWRLTGDHHELARRLEVRGFHAPRWLGRMLTGTDDSPLCVVDRASGFTMFCANAKVVGPRLIEATAGAITYHRSNGLDHRNPRSNDRRNFTSRGRISDAMVIRRDLVRYGVAHGTDLGHVLHMFLVETRTRDGFRSPMVGAESENYGFGAQGERIAVAPWVDLTRRDLSPEALVIARTLQNYGCYIGDNSGSGSALKAEQENSARPVWKGRLNRDSLAGLTWDDFVVLA
jgi:hypothetical protein